MPDSQELLFFAKPSLRRAFFYSFIFAATVLYGRIATDLDPRFNQFWWGCFALYGVLFFWALLKRWSTSYSITSEEVRCASGILARRVVVVPLERITNAAANQTFLDRILGLVNLGLDTAGGDTTEIVFARIRRIEGTIAARIIRERTSSSHSTRPERRSIAVND